MLRRNTRTDESKEEEDGNGCGEGERWSRDRWQKETSIPVATFFPFGEIAPKRFLSYE